MTAGIERLLMLLAALVATIAVVSKTGLILWVGTIMPHLDLANARRILHVLSTLKAAGNTIILTTHDPNAAAAIADYVILLREGRVLSAGLAAATMSAENLSATYGVDVEVLQVKGRPLVLAHTLSGLV